jgi:hypothetical protein
VVASPKTARDSTCSAARSNAGFSHHSTSAAISGLARNAKVSTSASGR